MTAVGLNPGHLAGGNTRGDRAEHDFYATTSGFVTDAIINAEGKRWSELGGRLWEPAAGEGDMVRPLCAAGFDVRASDVVDRGFKQSEICDFYDYRDHDGRLHVTNPPFSECNTNAGHKWIVHARSIGFQYMALMLPVQWDAPESREALFEVWKPARKYVLRQRPDWTGGGNPTGYVAWYVWDGNRSMRDPVDLHYISGRNQSVMDLSVVGGAMADAS